MHYLLCYQHPPHCVAGVTCRNWCCFHVVVTLFEEFCHTLNRREIGARAAFVMSFMEQAVSCTGLFSSPLLTCLQPHLVSPVLLMYQCRRVSLWCSDRIQQFHPQFRRFEILHFHNPVVKEQSVFVQFWKTGRER